MIAQCTPSIPDSMEKDAGLIKGEVTSRATAGASGSPAFDAPLNRSALPNSATVGGEDCWVIESKPKAAKVKKGSGTPNTHKVGKVNRAQLEEVATQKWPDLTAADMDAAVRTIAGSARSAGIEVEGVN